MIGKVVQVTTCQGCYKGGSKKNYASETSTLAPGIGVTQQLFATMDFLDEPSAGKDKQDDKEDDDKKELYRE